MNKQQLEKKTAYASQAPQYVGRNIKQFYANSGDDSTITLHTKDMKGFTKQGKISYHEVHIEAFKNKQLICTMDATHGVVDTHNGNKITLSEKVFAKCIATEQQQASTFKTSVLTINPKTRQAMSDEMVYLEQPNMQISGQGLHVDLETGTIKLLSDIKTRYVPTQPQDE